MTPHVSLFAVSRLVGRLVGHNCLKGRKVTLPSSSYQSTCSSTTKAHWKEGNSILQIFFASGKMVWSLLGHSFNGESSCASICSTRTREPSVEDMCFIYVFQSLFYLQYVHYIKLFLSHMLFIILFYA